MSNDEKQIVKTMQKLNAKIIFNIRKNNMVYDKSICDIIKKSQINIVLYQNNKIEFNKNSELYFSLLNERSVIHNNNKFIEIY